MSKTTFLAKIKLFISSHLVPVIATSAILVVGVSAGVVAIVLNSQPKQETSLNQENTDLAQNSENEKPKQEDETDNKTENSDNSATDTDNKLAEQNTSKPNTSQNQNSGSSQPKPVEKPGNSNTNSSSNNSSSSQTPTPSQPTTTMPSNADKTDSSTAQTNGWENCGSGCRYRMRNGEIVELDGEYNGEVPLPVYSWGNLSAAYRNANPDKTRVKFTCADGVAIDMSYSDFIRTQYPINRAVYWCSEKQSAGLNHPGATLYDANGTELTGLGGYL